MPESTPTQTRTIDGHTYEVKLLDAYSAVPIWHKVFKVLIASLDAVSGANVAAVLDAGEAASLSQLAVIGKIATRLASVAMKEMDPVDLRLCIDAFAGVTNLDLGGPEKPVLRGVIATHFAGRLASMAKWFAFCVEVNFGDFLGLARAMMASAQQRKPAPSADVAATATPPSDSPATSTG